MDSTLMRASLYGLARRHNMTRKQMNLLSAIMPLNKAKHTVTCFIQRSREYNSAGALEENQKDLVENNTMTECSLNEIFFIFKIFISVLTKSSLTPKENIFLSPQMANFKEKKIFLGETVSQKTIFLGETRRVWFVSIICLVL